MKQFSKIVYDNEIEYRFISSYYDLPLKGICYHLGILYEFQRVQLEEYFDDYLELYSLNPFEEFKWKFKQWWFETCVGYHWSWYPKNNKRQTGFYYRKPVWFYKLLMKLYYKLKWK